MRSEFAALLAFSSAAYAVPLLDVGGLFSNLQPAPANDPRWTNWQAPGPNDLRSACPGLNALANHNFINHNGSDLTIPAVITGLATGLGVGPDFAVFSGAGALLTTSNPLAGIFDLSVINRHGFVIEYDASISRQDAYFGNDYSFYAPNWEQYLGHFSGDMTDIKSIGAAKYSRYNDSLVKNPSFTYGPREMVLNYGNNAMITQVLGQSPSATGARVDFMRMFFEQEKLPWELGWRPSSTPVNMESIGELLLQLYTESPEPIAEAVRITADSYKDVFAALVGGSENLNNLTGGISSALGL